MATALTRAVEALIIFCLLAYFAWPLGHLLADVFMRIAGVMQ